MSAKTCNKCGNYTICVIGNYYQCPKCESVDSSSVATAGSAKDTFIYWTAHPPNQRAGQKNSFWGENKRSHSVDYYKKWRVVGKHSARTCDGYDEGVAYTIEAIEDITFEEVK